MVTLTREIVSIGATIGVYSQFGVLIGGTEIVTRIFGLCKIPEGTILCYVIVRRSYAISGVRVLRKQKRCDTIG